MERAESSPQAGTEQSGISSDDVAGTAGLEPADEGVKVPCLTTWLRPYVERGNRGNPDPLLLLGWEMGLEPTTPGTTIRCSNQLSYTHHISTVQLSGICLTNARRKAWHARRDSNPWPTA